MKSSILVAHVTAAVVLFAGADVARAQSWNGPYVGGQIGYGVQQDSADKIVRFDKNLDLDFRDVVTTAAGVNAFSPGFCAGAAVTPTPAGGCSKDRDAVRLAGWSFRARSRGRVVFRRPN
jgi:outer membrane immunogenic protein